MRTKKGGVISNKLRLSRGQTVTWLQNIACGGFVHRSRTQIMSNEDKEIGGAGMEEQGMARQK